MNDKETQFMNNLMQFIIDYLEMTRGDNIIYDYIEMVLTNKQIRDHYKRRRK